MQKMLGVKIWAVSHTMGRHDILKLNLLGVRSQLSTLLLGIILYLPRLHINIYKIELARVYL